VSMWLVAVLVILLGAAAPSAVMGMRGSPVDRLAGLQQLTAATTSVLMLLAQAFDRPDYLIVPLALVLLSFAGALVFARLLGPRR
jgi:multisubunit Na+/H+ antiporter MnhF subunit